MKYTSLAGAIVLGLAALNTEGLGSITAAVLACGLFISASVYSLAPKTHTWKLNRQLELERVPVASAR
jgi:uncharacterized protein (DUF58 family)